MAHHEVIRSNDVVTGLVVMKWSDAVTAEVTDSNKVVTK